MRIAYSDRIAKEQREKFRQILFEKGYTSNFEKRSLKRIMKFRFENIQNYMSEFGIYFLGYYKEASFFKRKLLHILLGKLRIYQIIESYDNKREEYFITIDEVFRLYRFLNLKKDFITYFATKTQLSYTVFKNHTITPIVNAKPKAKRPEVAFKYKVSQFIIGIMTEYIVLHNLMFASGYKLKDVKSIDEWLESI